MKRRGYFTWLHHKMPIEYTWDLDERLDYIRTYKPPHEVAPRLAAIVRVPAERLPRELVEAEHAYNEAWCVYDKARRAYDKARCTHAPALLALARELAPEAPYDHEAKCLVFPREEA